MNEFTKTIVNGLKTYVQNNIKKARSNWNQNDETAIDYVKNRTHWTETKFVDVIPETTLYSSSGRTRDAASPSLTMFYVTSEHISEIPNFTIGEKYTVIWNGTEYKCKAKMVNEVACLGNESIAGGTINTGEPFFIMPDTFDFYREESSDDVLCMVGTTESLTEVTIKVSGLVTTVHKIDAKYLPEIKNIKNLVDGEAEGSVRTVGTSTDIGKYAFAEGVDTCASGLHSHAEGCYTATEGNDSHAEGYGTIAHGQSSHAEGYGTIARGQSSHAEGSQTVAIGYTSHAEGYQTTAAGKYSHAEGCGSHNSFSISLTGNTTGNVYSVDSWSSELYPGNYVTYNGNFSEIINVSEKNKTITLYNSNFTNGSATVTAFIVQGIASGEYSHSEGRDTHAVADYSHAEGWHTVAAGTASHAEGNYTIANGNQQHVQGKYNIEDTENKYAHIVGNGTGTVSRANAHTLDWDGNAWFAGNIKLGGTSQDDENAVEVATKNYVDEQLNSASSSKLISHVLPIEATEENQTIFPINLETFDAANDTILVQDGITLLLPNSGFTIENNTIVMTTPWELGDTGSILILKNTPVLADEATISGAVIENNSITLDKLSADITTELDEIKKSASDGKALVAGAITEKGIETAADATFETMANNIDSIITLDSVPSLKAAEITPGASDQVIAAGNYLKGDQTIKGDANLVAANIAKGKSIFGVTGTYDPGTTYSSFEMLDARDGDNITFSKSPKMIFIRFYKYSKTLNDYNIHTCFLIPNSSNVKYFVLQGTISNNSGTVLSSTGTLTYDTYYRLTTTGSDSVQILWWKNSNYISIDGTQPDVRAHILY